MGDQFPDYQFLIRCQSETVAQTKKVWDELIGTWHNVINLLFRLPYFKKENYQDTASKVYDYWCFERFWRLPYTIQSVYEMWLVGEYLESSILIRYLLECFVQIHYFLIHKDKIEAHLTSTSRAGRIQFKAMFDDLAPGSYKQYYGTFSSFAHSGVAAGLFAYRLPPSAAHQELRLRLEFDKEHSALIMNMLLLLVYGFVNFFPHCFPSYTQYVDKDTEQQRIEMLESLIKWRRGLEGVDPSSKEFFSIFSTMVGMGG